MTGLLDLLAGRVLVADGAMGTVLHAAGNPLERALPELSVSDPELVRGIHDSYLAAGVDLIQTNTFGAGPLRLAEHGLAGRTVEINTAAVDLARAAVAAAGRPAFVAGSVSPAVTVHQRGRVPAAARVAALREQVGVLVAAGVDVLVCETFGHLDELVEAAGVAADAGGPLPVIAQATFAADGRTLSGHTPRDVCRALDGLPVAVLGTNCTLGPQGVLAIVERLREHTSLPISALPNAGLPRRRGPSFSYDVDAGYVARYAERLVAAGAAIVGGCCGTTPTHLAAVVAAVRGGAGAADPPAPARTEPVRPAPAGRPRRPVQVLAEIEPPLAGRVTDAVARAARVRALGVDGVWVPPGDGPRARPSPVNLAVHLQNRLGVDAVAGVATWDRTIMALQADLLGAHALGVHRVVCETGSPPLVGDYPHVDGVWDVDAVGLVELLAGLNAGRDRNGLPVAGRTAFEIGARVAPDGRDHEAEIARARRKLAAGATFLVTRPVHDPGGVRRLRAALGDVVPLHALVRPLATYAEAEFLAHEVPDVAVPRATLDALAAAGPDAAAVGLDLAAALVAALRPLVDGLVLALPDDRDAAARLLTAARGTPAPDHPGTGRAG